MLRFPTMIATAGMLLALSACGSTETERTATGGLGGAAAGAVVGGPVGAVVGGVGGAAAGSTMNEGLNEKVEDWTGNGSGSTAAQTQAGRRNAPAASTQALSQERIREVQQALNDNGSHIGVDGVWGPNTRRALRDFQRSKGLDATGRLDSQTVAALNVPGQPDNAARSGTSGRPDDRNPADTGQSGNTGQPSRQ